MYRLIVEGGKYDGRKLRLPLHGTIVVGRDQDCQLRLASTAVSRHHCQFMLDGPALRIRDLGSNNGTWVNGERISETVELKPGDRIQVGPMRLRVELAPRTGPMMVQPTAPAPEARTAKATQPPAENSASASAIDEDAIASWLTDAGGDIPGHDTEILPGRPNIPMKKKFRSIAEEGDEIIRRYLEMVGKRPPGKDDTDD